MEEQNNNAASQQSESANGSAPNPNDNQTSANVSMPDPSNLPSANTPEKKKPKLLMMLLLALLLVGGAAAAYYYISNGKEEETTTTTEVVKKEIPLLKMAVQSDSLNIELPYDSLSDDTLQLLQQTHEGLVSWSELTNFAPAIAKSWTTSADGTTWEFTIDTDRRFHTGASVTPESIKASIDAFIALDSELPSIQTIAAVTAKSADVLEITTKAPDATLLNRLASLPIYDTSYTEGQAWNSGTGAFKLKTDSVVSDTMLSLVANDNFPKAKPMVREVEVSVVASNEEALTGLQDGTYDISTSGPSNKEGIDALTDTYSFTAMKGTGSYALRLNNIREGAVFSNKALREAVAYIIDNKAIIAADVNQPGEPTNQLVPDTIPGYNPNIKTIEQDVDKAKELLAAAGYANEEIIVGYFEGVQDDAMLEVIKQLEAAGLNITVETKDSGRDFGEAIANGEYDIISVSALSNINDLSDVAADVAGKNSYTPMFYDPKVDEMIDEANKVFDPAERLAKLQDISSYIMDEFAVVPIRISLYPNYVKKNIVTGKMDLPTTSNPYYLYKLYGN